jgi:hypothetical protein
MRRAGEALLDRFEAGGLDQRIASTPEILALVRAGEVIKITEALARLGRGKRRPERAFWATTEGTGIRRSRILDHSLVAIDKEEAADPRCDACNYGRGSRGRRAQGKCATCGAFLCWICDAEFHQKPELMDCTWFQALSEE